MKKTQSLVAAAIALLIPLAVEAEPRTWTSSDGKSLEAEFAGTSGAGATAAVKLKMADGKIINYPVAKLSEADRLFVKGNLPTDPAALAAAIDGLVVAKAKSSYGELREELAKLPGKTDLTNAEKGKRKEEIEREMQMCAPNEMTNDNQFLRRIYLDVAGRIPTFDEAEAFLNNRSATKRAELINELLDSDAYVMRMYNYYSDLLRVREGIVMMGNGDIKADPYIEYLKASIRDDKPFNDLVREMLTATGKIWDEPAAGYLIADSGMRLCNLSNSFTVFMGTEITCAQCHDHPFEEVMQMDFFKMAAFMGETETRAGGGSMMMSGGDYRSEVARMNKVLKAAGKLRENQETDQNLGQWFGTHRTQVNDDGSNAVKLPHDYKYDDGEPEMSVKPSAYFGSIVNVEEFDSPRHAFADWMVAPDNPRFTINTVNRLWKIAFGLAQIEPVYNIPGHLDGQAQNYELLTFLEEMMKDLDYSVKDFFRVVYNTNTYQREAETMSPSLTQVDKGTYHFPGPILRRMTAEQIWDSLVALTTPNPEEVIRRGAESYKATMNTDPASLKTADDIMGWKEQFSKASKLVKYGGSGDAVSKDDYVDGEMMFRASELRQPMRAGHFLRMFGQSDKQLIENQFTGGSSPQVMALLNGKITNAVLTSPDAYLIKEIANGRGSKKDKIEKIFLSVLARYPSSEEKSMAQSGMRAKTDRSMSEKQKEEEEALAIGNVIWALVNTREFMFIQ
ncbi:DUF1549 domain-containing protein [Verrucomicrobiales bacterium]|nr:DUF1549 domain-containing protein [Verrucomicrobiales bacterium]